MRRLLLVLLAVASVGLVVRGAVPCAVLAVQPRCTVALHPGPTADTATVVEVTGERTYASSGTFLLTTVAVDTELDLLEWLRSGVSPRVRQIPRGELYPPGDSEEQVRQANIAQMDESELSATAAALRALGYPVDTTPTGGEVVTILAGSPAARSLQVGDVIVAVDGAGTTTAQAVADRIDAAEIGRTVEVTIERGDRRRDVTVAVAEDPSAPGESTIGVTVRDHIELPVHVDIDAGAVGGPSAGLVFAVTIIDALLPEDLTGGWVIAGTGTVDLHGNVGAVGGIRQKVLGALERAPTDSASVFLVPRGNLDEARGAPVGDDILLVPVGTLDEAVAALRELSAGREPADAVALAGR